MIGATRNLAAFVCGTLQGHYRLFLSAAAAISLSLAFVPRGAELGLLNLELGFPHQALDILEGNVAAGDSSAATIGALAQARAQVGNLPGAISLLEQLLEEHPRDPDLLQTLAGHYRRLGRPEASLRVLERLAAVQPSQASLRELAGLYGELKRPVEQRRVLRQLVTSPRADTADFVELAKIAKAMGNPGAGIEVLKRRETLRPAAIDTSIMALDLALRISTDQAEIAFERAARWVARSRTPSRDVLPLASVFSVQGYPALALNLLAPFAGQARDSTLVLAISQAEIDTGRNEAALQRLEAFAAGVKGRISPEPAQLRLRLAASMGRYARAADAASAMGVSSIPMDLLAAAATASKRSGRPDIAEAIRTRLRNEQSTIAPVYVAETSLALGDRDAASEWAIRAAPDAHGNPEIATKLARLALSLTNRRLALAILRSGLPFVFQDSQRPEFRGNRHVPENLLGAVARLYGELGMIAEGQMVLEVLRGKQPSAEADQAWAIAAAMMRRSDAVIAWLGTQDDARIKPDFLKELVFTAIKSGSAGLALSGATRLAQARGSDSDRMLLAEVKVLFEAPLVRLKPGGSLASAGSLNRITTR